MIDLKKTKQQMKKESKAVPLGDSNQEAYPWGTRLRFSKPEIDKIDALKKANAGDKVRIMAIGKVLEVSTSNTESGKDHHSVEVQIQKIKIMGNEKDMPEDEMDAFNSKDD